MSKADAERCEHYGGFVSALDIRLDAWIHPMNRGGCGHGRARLLFATTWKTKALSVKFAGDTSITRTTLGIWDSDGELRLTSITMSDGTPEGDQRSSWHYHADGQ